MTTRLFATNDAALETCNAIAKRFIEDLANEIKTLSLAEQQATLDLVWGELEFRWEDGPLSHIPLDTIRAEPGLVERVRALEELCARYGMK